MGLLSINKSLLAPKAAYFFFFFSYSSATPYIVVFLSSNGLNAEQAGYILGARFFAQFVSGPFWGAIADKTRKYKLVLLLQIVASTIFLFAAPWVPMFVPKDMQSAENCSVKKQPTHLPTFSTPAKLSIPMMRNLTTQIPENYSFSSKVEKAEVGFDTKTPTVNSEIFLQGTTTDKSQASTASMNNISFHDANLTGYVDKNEMLFKIMLALFVLVGAFFGGILLLVDNAVISTYKETTKSDFGKQRLWGAVGFGLASLASGVGIELTGARGPNYFTMFYIFLGSNVCLTIACCFLKMPVHEKRDEDSVEKKDNVHILKGLGKAFKKFNVTFFFLTILMMGMADSLLNSFLFLYIQDLHGSKIVMGLGNLVGCLAEAIFFPFADLTIKLLRGNLPSVAVAFAVYSIRFLGFSLIQNAWLTLPLHLLHSLCFALFWAATVQHTAHLAPEGMKATFLGIQNGIFFGIAGGTSCIIGGIIYKHFGGRSLYRGYAGICAIWTFFLFLHIIERRSKGKFQIEMNGNQRGEDDLDKEMDEIPASKRLFEEEFIE